MREIDRINWDPFICADKCLDRWFRWWHLYLRPVYYFASGFAMAYCLLR